MRSRWIRRLIGGILCLAIFIGMFPTTWVRASGENINPTIVTKMTGVPTISEAEATKWLQNKLANHPQKEKYLQLVNLYYRYGEKTGIRGDILLAQSAHETGYWTYSGVVTPEMNNVAGIKVEDTSGFANSDTDPSAHQKFATLEDGVRSHFNHIAAYVYSDVVLIAKGFPLKENIVNIENQSLLTTDNNNGVVENGEYHGRYNVVYKMFKNEMRDTLLLLAQRYCPGDLYYTYKVTIKMNEIKGMNITKISNITGLSERLNLYVGQNHSMNLLYTPANASQPYFSFTSSNSKIATVNEKGIIEGVSSGVATITIRAMENWGMVKSFTVEVYPFTAPLPPQSIKVTGISGNFSSATVEKNLTKPLVLTVLPSNASDKRVRYISSNTNIAEVSSTGLITAKNIGTVIITAITEDGNYKLLTTIYVTQKGTVSTSGGNLNVRSTASSTGKVVKTIKNQSVVIVYEMKNGFYRIGNNEWVSGSYIKLNSIPITVPKPPNVSSSIVKVTGVSTNFKSISLVKGEIKSIISRIFPTNASNKGVTYSSSNGGVATVSATGVISAKGIGVTTITVKTKEGGKVAKINVRVTQVGIVNLKNGTLSIRNSASLKGKKIGSLNKGKTVTIYEIKNGFYRIGTNRWVSSTYIKLK